MPRRRRGLLDESSSGGARPADKAEPTVQEAGEGPSFSRMAPTRVDKNVLADLLTHQAVSCSGSVARRRLTQDFVFGYRQDPSLPLQLWLDAAADAGEVACRLRAAEIHRQTLAAGYSCEQMWAHAQGVALVPPPHEAEILAAGRRIEQAPGLQTLRVDTPEFSFVCLLVLSFAHAPSVDLSGRGLDRLALRLLRPALVTMPRLNALRLENNGLGSDAVAELIDLKLHRPQLAWLNLAGNQLSAEESKLVLQMVAQDADAELLACVQHRELTRRDWSRLSIDTPLQASLGHNSLKLADRLAACHGLGRVAGLDLSAIDWRDLHSLTAGLAALCGARTLWSLRLHLDPEQRQAAAKGSWWLPALAQLARLPALKALHLDNSPLHEAADIAAFDEKIGGLKRLELVILSTGFPSWASDELGALAMAKLADILDREDVAMTPTEAQPEFGKATPAMGSLVATGMPPPPVVMAEDLYRACATPVGLYLMLPPNAAITTANSSVCGLVTDGSELDSHILHLTLRAQRLEPTTIAAIDRQRARRGGDAGRVQHAAAQATIAGDDPSGQHHRQGAGRAQPADRPSRRRPASHPGSLTASAGPN